MNVQHLGKRIKMARKDKGLTTEELSSLCNINGTYLRQIESGRKTPSLSIFLDICNYLETSPIYLLQDSLLKNEFTVYQDLVKLWDTATPHQIEMILKMIEIATTQRKSEDNSTIP